VAAFTDLVITGTAGDRTLSFTSGTLTSATSGTIAVSAGAATQLTITTEPSASAQSGVALAQQPVIQLRDASGNAVSQSGVEVVAAIASGGGTLGGTDTVLTDGSGAAAFTDLVITGTAGDRTLSFTSGSLTGATSGTITLGPGVASLLVFTSQPENTTAGAAFGVVVTVRDAAGNTATDFDEYVTVTLAHGASGASLSGEATVAAVDGVATFTGLSIDSAGTGYELDASATDVTGTSSNAFDIAAGEATQLVLTVQPSDAAQDSTISPEIEVRALDSLGNLATSFEGDVSIAIETDPPGGSTLSGTSPKAASGGVATFSDLSIDKVGNGFKLRVTSGTLTGATSTTFNITSP